MRYRFCHLFQFFLTVWAVSPSATAQVPVTSHPLVLTNAAQVRALTPAEAAKKIPVRLQGVVVDIDRRYQFSMVDDMTGIYAEAPKRVLASLSRGDLIEVEGVSNPGRFAPFVDVRAAWILGKQKIPEPRLANWDDLVSGQLDAQWIEVSGVVRRVGSSTNFLNLEVELENGGGRIQVHAPGTNAGLAVDSTVRLRGVCYYQFNTERQVLRPYLSIPADEPILVTRSAVTNFNELQVLSIGSLMQFRAGETYVHRVRVRGVVILSQPGEGFWIHDSGHGIHVISGENELIKVGTEVDVFGFVKRGDYGPELEDATFRKTGKTVSMMPVVQLTKAGEALNHNADLVACDASIVEQWTTLDGCRLKLFDGITEFPAILRTTNRNEPPPRWLAGTRVRITGVCTVGFLVKPTTGGTLQPQYFQLLLRSPADIQILQLPSWWNAKHVAWVTGGAAAALLAMIGVVVWIGHRRLREQAEEQLKAETEFAAILNERNRMAREIHDTLSQGLSAISMQLEVVKRQLPPESKVRESLEVARALARTNMTAARKAIWNVRSQDLEDGDLATALGDVLRNLTEGAETKGELRVLGRMRRFAPVTENNLLRIGQEAITNAAKYAQAKNILVTLDFEERQFRLSVEDDGKGFDVQAPPPSEGGFGLQAMRERAAQLHAEYSITSGSGKGTVVMLVQPLSQ